MNKTILKTMIVVAAMAACKDKDDKNTDPKPKLTARQQALIGKDWKLHSIKMGGIDLTSTLPDCFRDNIIHHFTDDKNGYSDEGLSKCDQSDSQRMSLTWKMIANESKMVLNQDGSADTIEIVSVNGNELQYLYEGQTVILRY